MLCIPEADRRGSPEINAGSGMWVATPVTVCPPTIPELEGGVPAVMRRVELAGGIVAGRVAVGGPPVVGGSSRCCRRAATIRSSTDEDRSWSAAVTAV